ncbi:MAG: DHH family phosphoesterase, partial [Thermoplasmata archaeon]|nr:DHH family phosphoesterase [Thermoplasmata archaeon]
MSSKNTNSDRLLEVVGTFPRIAIVLHDNPDPDAVSSGLALANIAKNAGVTSRLVARGTIGFEENRLLLKALNADLTFVESIFSPDPEEAVALVDNSTPGENNPLSKEVVPEIIIDHHSTASPPDGVKFIQLDPTRGSTSSMMIDHLVALGIEIDGKLASGLFYGLLVDTHHFVWNMADEDYTNLAYVARLCDRRLLEELEHPPLDLDTVDILGRAIQNREIKEGFSLSCVDYITEQDALARAADFLLRQKGVHTSLIYG